MPEYVSRGKGEKKVPKSWIPKYDMIDAVKEINQHIEDSIDGLRRAGRPKEDIEKRKKQKLDGIDDFVKYLQGETKTDKEPEIDIISHGVSPWGKKLKMGDWYESDKIIRVTEFYPLKMRFRAEGKKGLLYFLKDLGIFKGWRIEWEDFGVPDTLGESGYFHYPNDLESRKKYADKLNRSIDAVPNYSKEPYMGKSWPGTKPQQIAFVWKRPPWRRGKQYEMVFIKETEPEPIGGGAINWRVPNTRKADEAKTLARHIRGKQRNSRTWGLTPKGLGERIKVQVIAPPVLPTVAKQKQHLLR